MKQQHIGIFSGSFNPIHIGHIILGSYLCEFTDLDEVWFVVSPQNPLKEAGSLIEDALRIEMVRLALEEYDRMFVSDVEFKLPRPSYTIDTLRYLSDNYPDKSFSLIIGGDNWRQFHRWKEYQTLINNYSIMVYPRMGDIVLIPRELEASVRCVSAPIVEISSTFVRENIGRGRNMRSFVPPLVYDFIVKNRLYGYSQK